MRDGQVFTQAVKYRFTPEELAELAQKMSEGIKDVEDAESRKKAITSQLKAEVEAASSNVRNISGKFRDGFEYRDTECVAHFIDERFEVEIYTTQGEFVERRAMRPEERQLVLEEVVEKKGGVAALRDADADADTGDTLGEAHVYDSNGETDEDVEESNGEEE
jgi:hypothetical protein